MRAILCLTLFVLTAGGCARHTITINSEPQGAMVYANDQEIGRTPLTRDFVWYGTYDVQLRMQGYETENRHATIIAPPWFWVPFDLVSELLPIKDHRERTFVMHPASTQPVDQTIMLSRAADLAAKLQSSEHTHPATTYPSATEPSE